LTCKWRRQPGIFSIDFGVGLVGNIASRRSRRWRFKYNSAGERPLDRGDARHCNRIIFVIHLRLRYELQDLAEDSVTIKMAGAVLTLKLNRLTKYVPV